MLVSVKIGTSAHLSEDSELAEKVAALVNRAYGYRRIDVYEAVQRLAMGDAGRRANRVLHLAYREGQRLVGCCSSTIQPPWTPTGCGHWGLLVVDPPAQGSGVASALVAAAEERLASHRCSMIQVEYEYTPGDPYSKRLYDWYKGKCGFTCPHGPPSTYRTQFRRLRKAVPTEAVKSALHSQSAETTECPRAREAESGPGEAHTVDGCSVVTTCPGLVRMLRVVACRLFL